MGSKKDKRVMRPVECCANCSSCYSEKGPGEPHSYYCGLDDPKPEVTVKFRSWMSIEDKDPEKAAEMIKIWEAETDKEMDWNQRNRINSEFSICQYYKQAEWFKEKYRNSIGKA